MKYTVENVNKNKETFTQWAENLAHDLDNSAEVVDQKDVFPNSDLGDIGTAKDLVGTLLVLLTGKDAEIL